MDNAMIPSLLLVLSILLVGVLALLVLLIIRARQSGLLTSASGVGQPPAKTPKALKKLRKSIFKRLF